MWYLSFLNSCFGFCQTEREREREKKTCWNVDWSYSIQVTFWIFEFSLVAGKENWRRVASLHTPTIQYISRKSSIWPSCVLFSPFFIFYRRATRRGRLSGIQVRQKMRFGGKFIRSIGRKEREREKERKKKLPGKQHNVCVLQVVLCGSCWAKKGEK